MQFTTKVPVPKSMHPINYDSKIVAMGSCFAENMGKKFDYFKFENDVNPFGIIFNPVSIEKLMSRIAEKRLFSENDIFSHNGLWHCYEVHSDLSHPDKAELLKTLNRIIEQSNDRIIEATHIIITYGTAWAYQLRSSESIVANCHKMPQNQFVKQLLSAETIQNAICNTVDLIHDINPGCSFVFTVSPVRHIKDGFVENNVSKAQLLSAVYKAISDKPQTLSYFPSYEIVMDELRDYRFYADDLLHPSQSAIDYIWEQFFLSHIEEAIFPVMEEVCAIRKSLLHKPFHPDSENHRKFLDSLDQKIGALTQKFPQIQF